MSVPGRLRSERWLAGAVPRFAGHAAAARSSASEGVAPGVASSACASLAQQSTPRRPRLLLHHLVPAPAARQLQTTQPRSPATPRLWHPPEPQPACWGAKPGRGSCTRPPRCVKAPLGRSWAPPSREGRAGAAGGSCQPLRTAPPTVPAAACQPPRVLSCRWHPSCSALCLWFVSETWRRQEAYAVPAAVGGCQPGSASADLRRSTALLLLPAGAK